MKQITGLLLLLFAAVWFSSCDENYTPKPRGYFRIDLPEKSYVKLDSVFPYRFEYPAYATITGDPFAPNEKNWINVNFPDFKAVLHISYEPVNNNLANFLDDAHTLVSKHIPKAEAIYDSLIYHPEKHVYGLAFKIEGMGTASPFQFYVTDSVKHYLRGALYFNLHPNNDSLAPVINFLEKDINHMISTLQWKKEDR
jgi:gliding motility-associated lipoprotein GldD